MNENQIATAVFDAALTVHRNLGPGLLESSYNACLAYELGLRGLFYETQKPLPLVYDDETRSRV